MKEKIGMDAFRYFVLREGVFGQDADFREESLTARYNSDLANNFGNLVSRVLAMQEKYFAGAVQPLGDEWSKEDVKLRDKFRQAENELKQHMEGLQFHRALESVWSALDHANRYTVQTSPFVLFKDPEKRGRVGEILHHLLEAIRTTGRLIAPFLPDTAKELQALLAIPEGAANSQTPWGSFFAPGHKVLPPKVLFPRIE
jgi:methionyl-tRNA synthetase